jgi:hypothetical protein
MDIEQIARDVIEKAEHVTPLPYMMSENVLRPGIVSIPLGGKIYVALETEWDDGEYLVASANHAPELARAVLAQADEIARLQEVEHKAIEQSEYIQSRGLTEYEMAQRHAMYAAALDKIRDQEAELSALRRAAEMARDIVLSVVSSNKGSIGDINNTYLPQISVKRADAALTALDEVLQGEKNGT